MMSQQQTRFMKLSIFAVLAAITISSRTMIKSEARKLLEPNSSWSEAMCFHHPPEHGVWCVAKPTMPSSLLQIAMDYACSSGAECGSIHVNGSCFQPDTVLAHASYAFNSYWQNMKNAGASCQFGGVAMLVTVDPSYNNCHFVYKE